MRHLDCQAGYTLIEVLLAGSLLILALVPMMRLLPGTAKHCQDNEAETHVRYLAQHQLEQLKLEAAIDFDRDYSGAGICQPPYATYRYEVLDKRTRDSRVFSISVWQDSNGDLLPGDEEHALTVTADYARRQS